MRILLLFCTLAVVAYGAPIKHQAAAKAPAKAVEAPVVVATPPIYPAESTLAALRLRDITALDAALENFRGWAMRHPSVMQFLSPVWSDLSAINAQKMLAARLDMTPAEMRAYFKGPMLLLIGNDFSQAQKQKMLPALIAVETDSVAKATEFLELIRSSSKTKGAPTVVGDTAYEHLLIEEEAPAQEDDKAAVVKQSSQEKAKKEQKVEEPYHLYIAARGKLVLVSNDSLYLEQNIKAQQGAVPSREPFWGKAAAADGALWVNVAPFVAFVQTQVEAAVAKAAEEGVSSKVDPKIIAKLGLDQITTVGATVHLNPFELRTELNYNPAAEGVVKLFTCAPVGLQATPLLPAEGVDGFSLGRWDVGAFWTQLKVLAKIVVPATETIYNGWQKQVKDTTGVNIDEQLFGAFGDKYLLYTSTDKEEADSYALFYSTKDSVALQSGLNAFFGFFDQGKPYFTRENIGKTPVWRLKSEYQVKHAPPVAYAITADWVIVNVGDPTQMQTLIEQTQNKKLSGLWSQKWAKEALGKDNALVFLNYKPMRRFARELASIAVEIDRRDADKNKTEPTFDAEKFPTFDDVKGSVVFTARNEPGSFSTLFKLYDNE